MNAVVNRINTPAKNIQCDIPSRASQNCQHISISPTFGGTPIEIKSKKLIDNIEKMSKDFTSAHNRLILGVTALASQPFFDLYNNDVDEKTRAVSCARTLGKIIAGTTVGVLVRHFSIKASEKLCEKGAKEVKGFFKNYKKWLLPKTVTEPTDKEIKKYQKAVGTFLGLGVSLFTNFLIDAPLTTYLTNVFNKGFQKKTDLSTQQQIEGGKK